MDQDSQEKYRVSATIAQKVLEQVVSAARPGCSVHMLCKYANDLVNSYTKAVFKKDKQIERGLSFPATISTNNFIQNFSPDEQHDIQLAPNDLVKILCVQLDGFIANVAYTFSLLPALQFNMSDKQTAVTCAAYYASEAALRLLSPGNKTADIVEIVGLIAKEFNCSVSEHSYTSQLDRFVSSGKKTFSNLKLPKNPNLISVIEAGDFYTVDIILSTGPGVSKDAICPPTIYSRNINKSYMLKIKSSRNLFSKVCKERSVFPFLMRDVMDSSTKTGIMECVRNDLLVPYKVTCDRNGEFVAQFKNTVFVHHTGPLRLTPNVLPNVPLLDIPQDSKIAGIINLPIKHIASASLPSNSEIDSISLGTTANSVSADMEMY
ncbi:hypothetical protein BB561_000418 [Smittium simulii]|uniref:Probable metalloprotease ARX1 n=1 Tax=Smittium simulii TaxID=133385 RepID=A0A2T9YZ94_9FUNG|nr:hypothetical protein BB561_000418 [Smittium simulii]